MNPRLAGCSFIHRGRSLRDGLTLASALGFRIVDVGVGGEHGHISPIKAAEEPELHAELVRASAEDSCLALNECFSLNFGPSVNHLSATIRGDTRRRFTGLVKFAARAGFRSILLLAGPEHADLGTQRSLDLSAEALKPLAELAFSRQVRLHVEPDCDSCARTPALAEELCLRVPGLRLTLDYSHFILRGHTQQEIEPLHRFAGHVHVRQAAPGSIIVPVERGVIDYGRVLQGLESVGYAGLFAVEYLACREADAAGIDCLVETRKMSEVLDEILSAARPA